MVDAGESKLLMSTRDTLVRAYMAGAILAWRLPLSVSINTGNQPDWRAAVSGRFLHVVPAGFRPANRCITWAAGGFDPSRRHLGGGCNWSLVVQRQLCRCDDGSRIHGHHFHQRLQRGPNAIGQKIDHIGEGRTVGYMPHMGRWHADPVYPRCHVQLDGVHRWLRP